VVLRHTLVNQLDYQLQAAGGRYASCMEQKHGEGPPPPTGVSVTNCNKTLPDRVPGANPRTEVGQVGTAFNRMLGHVESALARRAASEARLRRFAADASHELRTPLAAIRGYAELALRHPGPVPAATSTACTSPT